MILGQLEFIKRKKEEKNYRQLLLTTNQELKRSKEHLENSSYGTKSKLLTEFYGGLREFNIRKQKEINYAEGEKNRY